MPCLAYPSQSQGGTSAAVDKHSEFWPSSPCLLPVCKLLKAPVLCAGSRSSALTMAVALHPRARVVPCIDERSLAFWALGFGRAHGSAPAHVHCHVCQMRVLLWDQPVGA